MANSFKRLWETIKALRQLSAEQPQLTDEMKRKMAAQNAQVVKSVERRFDKMEDSLKTVTAAYAGTVFEERNKQLQNVNEKHRQQKEVLEKIQINPKQVEFDTSMGMLDKWEKALEGGGRVAASPSRASAVAAANARTGTAPQKNEES